MIGKAHSDSSNFKQKQSCDNANIRNIKLLMGLTLKLLAIPTIEVSRIMAQNQIIMMLYQKLIIISVKNTK